MVGHRSSLAGGLYQGCAKEPAIKFHFSTSAEKINKFGPQPSFTAVPRDGSAPYEVEADVVLAADGKIGRAHV